MKNQKNQLTHNEVVTKAGNVTLAKYGKDHFAKMGKRGAKSKLRQYGPDYFERLSKAGVMARQIKREQKKQAELENKISP